MRENSLLVHLVQQCMIFSSTQLMSKLKNINIVVLDELIMSFLSHEKLPTAENILLEIFVERL